MYFMPVAKWEIVKLISKATTDYKTQNIIKLVLFIF